MRLKHLYLHGFKTFAPKTELVFGEGLTAIVGPNGSGKSNVADAVRWVLGEQSLSNLRAKRTEDLIFAGSSNRAPLGMAEVSITIDNTDRLIPLEFGEVTLTRRAFRSGENEYYVNKSRVRLRDVLEVASTLGQAYTVVGQGLVDAALSLRPEERRELFEEAAAIRGYFVQREDALKRLGKTEENIARVNDLASELEPQVRRMERQARQAQEYKKLDSELRELLGLWYKARWRIGVESFQAAHNNEAAALVAVEERKSAMSAKTTELTEARARVWKLVDAVSALHEQRAQVQSRHAAGSQSQAVMSERLSSAGSQRQALQKERETLQAGAKNVTAQLAQLDVEAVRHTAEIETLQETSREVARKLAEIDTRLQEAQHLHNRDAGQLDALTRRAGDLQNRLTEAENQRAEKERAAVDAETALESLGARVRAEERALEERQAALSAAQRKVVEAERQQAASQQSLAAARSAQVNAETERRESIRRSDVLGSQLAALAGEQQASLFGGVRAVVAAANSGKLTGYVGTVAELIQVPSDLEAAIEGALGGRLQDVVVQTWSDAERAIAMLKAAGSGRATFLPLDTLRSSSSPAAPRGPGIVGVARDLVEFEPYLGTLADSLLGRLLIVEDLASARRTLSGIQTNSPWTLATIGGEVVRPGGSVTGGSNARADDSRAKGKTILARERRRRELTAAQEAARSTAAESDHAVERAIAVVRDCEAALALASSGTEESRKQQSGAQMAYLEQKNALARLNQELSWRTGLQAETHKNIEQLAVQLQQLAVQRDQVAGLVTPQQKVVEEALQRLENLRAERTLAAQSTGEGQTRLAVLAEALRNVRARENEVRREAQRIEARLREIDQRLSTAEADERSLALRVEQQAIEVKQLAEQLAATEVEVGQLEKQVRVYEGDVSRIEGEQSGVQAALLEAETLHSRAAVERQRCIGALDSLRVEIIEEVGRSREDNVSETLSHESTAPVGSAAWLRWPLPEREGSINAHGVMGGESDEDAGDNSECERRIFAMKARLSRLGPINPLAMEEHAALSERHTYLQEQLADLLTAAESLRRVIAELDRTMRDQFAATFELVNEAFQHFFSTLFGGGTARLELTNPQDVSASGVEILAQPPGKRMQPLAALSGGERALTSAALLFALLRVRPVPFCVLDEVDAALDESNVTRFRAALQELGQKTQFVVITHNRGTIEAADTLYGISMAGDGTSQMLSLKVEAA
ncbi:MAG: chromosome segregation protein SMC [Chloroflexota bacterium]